MPRENESADLGSLGDVSGPSEPPDSLTDSSVSIVNRKSYPTVEMRESDHKEGNPFPIDYSDEQCRNNTANEAERIPRRV